MNYKEKLSQICDEIDGANAAFICGFDGMLIEGHGNGDIEEIAAEWADICGKLVGSESLLKDFVATFSHYIIAIKPISSNGFVGIIMNIDANVGRAKFELNKLKSDFI